VGLAFGLLTAVSIGLSDLFGRHVLRSHGAVTTGVGIQFAALLTSVCGLAVVSSRFSFADLGFGLVSGIGMGIGLWAYFSGLAKSSSALVAPLVATLSALVPYLYALSRGASPTALAAAGAVMALIGLTLITVTGSRPAHFASGLRWGVASGMGYGLGLSVVIEASDASGSWPAVGQRITALASVVLLARTTTRPLLPPSGLRRFVIIGGVFAGLSTVFYLRGLESDTTSTVITASLFPAVTVLVGRVVYGDDVSSRQVAGLAVVLVGVIGVGLG
jgi:uncharacterized membrane protein